MRESIQAYYRIHAEALSEEYSYQEVPADIQHYFLLAELISIGSLEIFQDQYGPIPIDDKFALAGKNKYFKANDQKLTEFEIQVCDMWYIFSQSNKRSLRLI